MSHKELVKEYEQMLTGFDNMFRKLLNEPVDDKKIQDRSGKCEAFKKDKKPCSKNKKQGFDYCAIHLAHKNTKPVEVQGDFTPYEVDKVITFDDNGEELKPRTPSPVGDCSGNGIGSDSERSERSARSERSSTSQTLMPPNHRNRLRTTRSNIDEESVPNMDTFNENYRENMKSFEDIKNSY